MKKTTPQELLTASVGELQFANLQIEYLLSVLHELDTFCGTLEQAMIRNALERHSINKVIHAKILFK